MATWKNASMRYYTPSDQQGAQKDRTLDYGYTSAKTGQAVYNRPSTSSSVKSTSSSKSSGGYDASNLLAGAGIDPSQKSALFKQYGVTDTPSLLKAMQGQASDRQKEYEGKVRGEIEEGYKPVFSQLDAMIGNLPGQRGEIESQLGASEASQLANVASQEQMGLRSLGAQEEKQRNLATTSLRDLEDDIRNSMQAAGRYIGAQGAGDSSASYLASEALARQAQKGRAGILSTRDEAVGDIGLKMQDVSDLANQERNKIGQWKATKLTDVATTFQNQLQQLQLAKANASKEKANSLTNLISNSYQQFISQMQALDNQALQYSQQVDMWEMQRAAELEDYAKKLSISKSYAGPDADAYTNRVLALINQGLSSDAANQLAQSEGLSGSYLSADMFNNTEQSPSQMAGDVWSYDLGNQSFTAPSNYDFSSVGL